MTAIRQTIILIIGLFIVGAASAKDYSEGVEYEAIKPVVPTNVPAGKVEVVEMFWFGCPHCFQFEPHLQKWLKKKPANVEFIRMPATFNPLWKLHARAFYTAEILGVGEKMQQVIFEAYHLARNRLDTEKALRELFVENGVKGNDFDDVFHSFAVETRLARAVDLTQRYGITGVPAVIVNGKYRPSNKLSGHDSVLDVVDYLIKKESR